MNAEIAMCGRGFAAQTGRSGWHLPGASGEWEEETCAENRHEFYAEKDAEAPTADKPDF